MVDPASNRVSRAPPYSGTTSTSSPPFRLRGCHPLCQAFPKPFCYKDVFIITCRSYADVALQPLSCRFRLSSNFARHYFQNLFWFLFLELLRWFTPLSIALQTYFIQSRNVSITTNGLPHSAISGSKDVCSSPKLFAAYHGLHRLSAPLGIHHKPFISLDHIIATSLT